MRIDFNNNKFISYKPHIMRNASVVPYLNYNTQPAYDMVTFGALKKSLFDGLDLFVIEKFRAPIEKFHSYTDLQNWAEIETEKRLQQDFHGRKPETAKQRELLLKEWEDYILEEDVNFSNTRILLIIDAITKDLKPNNDILPPKFNENILNDCLIKASNELQKDRKYQFNLNKMYQTKLKSVFLDSEKESTDGFWIIIPSIENDLENFKTNVEKLKTLSSKFWCTKGASANYHLSKGDIHIYFENGRPRVGIRFSHDKIDEIQGEDNTRNKLFNYNEIIKKHIQEGNYKFTLSGQQNYNKVLRTCKKIEKLKKELQPAIEKNNVKAIFNQLGIKASSGENGMVNIEEYRQPDENFTFADLGIDENQLFEKIQKINGNANFEKSTLKSLKKLEIISGNANFKDSKIIDTGNLKYIGGNADFTNTKITTIGNLEYIKGDVTFINTHIIDLGKLKSAKTIFVAGETKLSEELLKTIDSENVIFSSQDCNSYLYD